MSTKTRFEKEAKGNSEMVYLILSYSAKVALISERELQEKFLFYYYNFSQQTDTSIIVSWLVVFFLIFCCCCYFYFFLCLFFFLMWGGGRGDGVIDFP